MRIGILGGTFNPVHSAHIQMAQISRDEAALDLVLLMVAADPPHKRVEGEVPAEVRLELVRLAAENEARVEPSDLEIQRGGKSYTLDTLLELQKRYPGAELFLVLGSDTLGDLPNWHKPEEVLKIASVLCVPRIGLSENDAETASALTAQYGAKIVLLGGKADRISSTEIRDRLEEGLDATGLLPDAVEQACYESGVYFPEEVRTLQQKLRSALSQKRYRHVCGTMRAAACLSQIWKQDAKKARVASLLHDCAKCLDPVTQEVLSGDDSGVYPVYHAFAGAVLARTDYGISDDTILRAIRLHTTGDAGMSDFDALVYAADLIEPTRTFFSVEEYRRRVNDGVDAFMRYALQRVSRLIAQKGWAVHPASARALAYYEKKIAE
ncbi:MAG: nicotinate (nicotinamide) nucleotide adenylyltransferase [Clostridiaceae bacterium]